MSFDELQIKRVDDNMTHDGLTTEFLVSSLENKDGVICKQEYNIREISKTYKKLNNNFCEIDVFNIPINHFLVNGMTNVTLQMSYHSNFLGAFDENAQIGECVLKLNGKVICSEILSVGQELILINFPNVVPIYQNTSLVIGMRMKTNYYHTFFNQMRVTITYDEILLRLGINKVIFNDYSFETTKGLKINCKNDNHVYEYQKLYDSVDDKFKMLYGVDLSDLFNDNMTIDI